VPPRYFERRGGAARASTSSSQADARDFGPRRAAALPDPDNHRHRPQRFNAKSQHLGSASIPAASGRRPAWIRKAISRLESTIPPIALRYLDDDATLREQSQAVERATQTRFDPRDANHGRRHPPSASARRSVTGWPSANGQPLNGPNRHGGHPTDKSIWFPRSRLLRAHPL